MPFFSSASAFWRKVSTVMAWAAENGAASRKAPRISLFFTIPPYFGRGGREPPPHERRLNAPSAGEAKQEARRGERRAEGRAAAEAFDARLAVGDGGEQASDELQREARGDAAMGAGAERKPGYPPRPALPALRSIGEGLLPIGWVAVDGVGTDGEDIGRRDGLAADFVVPCGASLEQPGDREEAERFVHQVRRARIADPVALGREQQRPAQRETDRADGREDEAGVELDQRLLLQIPGVAEQGVEEVALKPSRRRFPAEGAEEAEAVPGAAHQPFGRLVSRENSGGDDMIEGRLELR